jgi:hypothetical protein
MGIWRNDKLGGVKLHRTKPVTRGYRGTGKATQRGKDQQNTPQHLAAEEKTNLQQILMRMHMWIAKLTFQRESVARIPGND